MIGKVCRRGSDVRRLLGYLFRGGRAGTSGLASDHLDPRLVGGWDPELVAAPPRTGHGGVDLQLAGLLNAPLTLAEVDPSSGPVYHLAVSAAKDPRTGALLDPLLTDAQWADIAATYLDQIGLAPAGDPDGVRWVAVRHAEDHIHVVATLARQDGRRVWPHRDYAQSRHASHLVATGSPRPPATPPAGTKQRARARAGAPTGATARARPAARPSAGPRQRDTLRARVWLAGTPRRRPEVSSAATAATCSRPSPAANGPPPAPTGTCSAGLCAPPPPRRATCPGS